MRCVYMFILRGAQVAAPWAALREVKEKKHTHFRFRREHARSRQPGGVVTGARRQLLATSLNSWQRLFYNIRSVFINLNVRTTQHNTYM